MKIAVIGSGAIGGLVAGYLKHKGEDVLLVGRKDAVAAISANGLHISGVRGNLKIKIDILPALNKNVELVILAVKTQDIEKAVKENLGFLNNATILTTQNGMQADKILARHIARTQIISSIVMFGATYLEPHKIVHNFEGKWILGRPFAEESCPALPAGRQAAGRDDKLREVVSVLNKIFPTGISGDILGMKWLKMFLNASNCLPAILGKSMQETFNSLELCKLSMRLWQEGLDIINKSGIKLASLPDFPLERLTKLSALPLEESARIFCGIMTNLSREPLYGSVLQSIKRNRPSEIDYINGEFVALAGAKGFKSPLNERLVKLVRRVERSKRFLDLKELLEDTKEFLK